MCGIFGIFDLGGCLDNLHDIERATTAIRHRGPDDEGYLLCNTKNGKTLPCAGKDTVAGLDLPLITSINDSTYNLAFGFRRLSILDLSKDGHQPMSSNDEKLWIIFNGEVYNYLEIKDELLGLGYHFKSGTDTEVILAAYREWGKKCLERFTGMFAFAILDLQGANAKLFLARDQFGIKPLYYTITSKCFAFASEIKVLLNLPNISRKVNPQNVNDYLRRGFTDHNADTMFADIHHLPPAHYLELDLANPKLCIQPVSYWKVDLTNSIQISFQEAVQTLRQLFLDSIRLHLRSDVSVGAALSGGIDSSAIVASMRSMVPELSLHTFSYLAEDNDINEEQWVDIVAHNTSSLSHKTKLCGAELTNSLENLIYVQDEPFGSTSILAQNRVFYLAQQHDIKVMLDGQGADELFAGYTIYKGARFSSLMRQWRVLEAMRFQRGVAGESKQLDLSFLLYTAGAAVLPPSMHLGMRKIIGHDRVSPALNLNWFTERNVIPYSSVYASKSQDVMREQLVESTFKAGLPSLLRYEDRNSMCYSIESRVPFLTTRLAEFAFSMPEEYLLSNRGVSKHVFREAMRGIVPDAILNRKDKIGFQTPEQTWIEPIMAWTERILIKDGLDIPVVNKKAIVDDWEKVKQNRRRFDFRFWRYLNFILWANQFKVTFD